MNPSENPVDPLVPSSQGVPTPPINTSPVPSPEIASALADIEAEASAPVPRVNLLDHMQKTEAPAAPVYVAPPMPPVSAPTPAPAPVAPQVVPTAPPAPKFNKKVIIIGAVAVASLIFAGIYYFAVTNKVDTKSTPIAETLDPETPTENADQQASELPTQQATEVPASTEAQTPASATATSTSEVTVKAAKGIWFRSSPTSDTKSNIIGWIPNGGKISVDSRADSFWWHGTYKGKVGYFAQKYTQ